MTATLSIPFDNELNYSFSDTNQIGLALSKLLAKDQTPADAISWATYTTNINLNYGGGTLIGTPFNGAAIVGSRLDLTGGLNRYVTYIAAGNIDSVSPNIGAIKFKITPNYSGAPAALRDIITISGGGATSANLIYLAHAASGNFSFVLRNSASGVVFNTALAAWSPTAGVTYEFEINYDIVSGASRLFIDGVQVGLTQIGTGTRNAGVEIRIGTGTVVGSGLSDQYIEDLVFFDSVQHTSNYTAGYILGETIYSTNNPYADCNNFNFKASEFILFAGSEVKTGNDEIKYIIKIDSQFKYITGGVLTNSDGTYAQANTLAELILYADLFLSTRSVINVARIFTHCDIGDTTPTLDLFSATYNNVLPDVNITTKDIECFLYYGGLPLANATIEIRPYAGAWGYEGVLETREWRTIGPSTSIGWLEFELQENPTTDQWLMRHAGETYKFSIYDMSGIVDLSTLIESSDRVEDE